MKRMRTTSVIFFNDTATTEIYTLSLHDALPISASGGPECGFAKWKTTQTRRAATRVDDLTPPGHGEIVGGRADRKSTRLNSSHANISYAVFCLKKKNKPRAGTYSYCLLSRKLTL